MLLLLLLLLLLPLPMQLVVLCPIMLLQLLLLLLKAGYAALLLESRLCISASQLCYGMLSQRHLN